MTTPLHKKLGLKNGMRAILIDAPAEALAAIDLPADDLTQRLAGSFDYIHVFVKDQRNLDAAFPKLKGHLLKGGTLWVSWPKGGRLGTEPGPLSSSPSPRKENSTITAMESWKIQIDSP